MTPASLRSCAALALSATAVFGPQLALAECLQTPVSCTVTSGYGKRYDPIKKNFSTEDHKGIDFGCPTGTPDLAAQSGSVVVANWSNSAGHWVVIRGSDGTVTKYMHHSRLAVGAGKTVQRGEAIGLTGNTGNSTGPHMHFQVEVGGRAVDPTTKMCSAPPVQDGVLQGGSPAPGDVLAPATQVTAPSDDGGIPPAMGMDGSLTEILADVIGSRALNPDYMRQLATLSGPRLYAELAYLQSIRLKVQHERALRRERIEATQAMLTLLRTEAVLRPQLEVQRNAAAARP